MVLHLRLNLIFSREWDFDSYFFKLLHLTFWFWWGVCQVPIVLHFWLTVLHNFVNSKISGKIWDPNGMHSWTQMRFCPITKCSSVPYTNAIWPRIELKCDLFPGLYRFGPWPKCTWFPDWSVLRPLTGKMFSVASNVPVRWLIQANTFTPQ